MKTRSGKVGVGVIGFGTIGTGVVRILSEHAASIADRLGGDLEMVRVADLDTTTDRGVALADGVLIDDARALIADPDVDVVVELVGGMEPAKTFLLEAIAAGKSVVTANKALLSEHGPELAAAAERQGVALGFEASVGGGIPIVRVLREALAGDVNSEVYGIVNGTANYILSEMSAGNGEFAGVLEHAQKMGLAEADPTYDVDGIDSLHKLVILVALAFGKRIQPSDVHVEGIREISSVDIEYAQEFGYAIKLLAVARNTDEGVEARVHPSMVPTGHLLSQVSGAFNAVCLGGAALGTSIYYGQGAGMMPTATAVVADVIDAARLRLHCEEGDSGRRKASATYGLPLEQLAQANVVPMADTRHEHYLRLNCEDRPGMLASIAALLADEGISLATVSQHGARSGDSVPVVMRTHRALEAAMSRALERIAALDGVHGKPVVIRVEQTLGSEEG